MSQKVENLLNLALDSTAAEREKSLNLDVGYDPIDREWDLIVKYSGSLEAVRGLAVSVNEMVNEYAVVTVAESRIPLLSQLAEVEYIEKPKRLFFQVENGKRVSCISNVQQAPFSLRGKGVLVGIVDSGIDYTLDDFRNMDGTTRIYSLWDQSIAGNPPPGYEVGTEYTREEINLALTAGNVQERRQIVPSQDVSGHGTAVAGIAAGSGRRAAMGQPGQGAVGGQGLAGGQGMQVVQGTQAGQSLQNSQVGVAPESELIVVKMGNPRSDGFPRTTELMMGVDYIIRKAQELGMPVAVNISFGNTYGSHDGTSLLERYLDDISNYWKSVICVGSGNEGTTAGHTAGVLTMGKEQEIQFGVQESEPTVNIQIWKSYVDEFGISIVSPSGVRVGPIQEQLGSQRFTLGQTEVLLYYGEPAPYSVRQEVYLDFLPRQSYIDAGVWRIVLTPRHIVSGEYQMWMPVQSALNVGTSFLQPVSNMTLTIPSTAMRVITVGAYDALTFSYADFSGRGAYGFSVAVQAGSGVGAGQIDLVMTKPDLVAPGVNVTTTAVGGGYTQVSGTSFAAPFVTGSAALLMQWGIVEGNDPYLYGEKVKAYLRRGARPLPGFTAYPNNQVGYGALCVRESLPV